MVYELKLCAPDTAEGRVDMARMLRTNAEAMMAISRELEDRAIREIGGLIR